MFGKFSNMEELVILNSIPYIINLYLFYVLRSKILISNFFQFHLKI